MSQATWIDNLLRVNRGTPFPGHPWAHPWAGDRAPWASWRILGQVIGQSATLSWQSGILTRQSRTLGTLGILTRQSGTVSGCAAEM